MDTRPRAPFASSASYNSGASRQRVPSTGKENANDHGLDQPRPSSIFVAPSRGLKERGLKTNDDGDDSDKTPLRRDGKAMSMGAHASTGLVSQQFSQLLVGPAILR